MNDQVIALAAFDAATGRHLATGSASTTNFREATQDFDPAEARANCAAKRRRIAPGAILVDALSADLIVDGKPASFADVEQPSPTP